MPILLVLLIGVLVYNSGTLTPRRRPGAAGPQPAGTARVAAAGVQIPWQSPPEFTAAIQDPMARKLATLSSRRILTRDELVVTGIATDGQTPRALIGTEIVEQGQTIMGATVTRITPDSVEFEMDGKTWTQKVRDTEVRE
jgi:hypothetical protein